MSKEIEKPKYRWLIVAGRDFAFCPKTGKRVHLSEEEWDQYYQALTHLEGDNHGEKEAQETTDTD